MTLTCIAVVDDEAPVRVALGRVLRLAGFEVLAYASGEEFLAALAKRVPDCVLLDVHMPGLTGLEVRLRLRSDGLELPLVFITASEDVAIARNALDAGGLQILHKPISSEALLAAIAFALRHAAPRLM